VVAVVRGRLVAWWRGLRSRELWSRLVPAEPAGGWFWWEYRTPPAEPGENEDQADNENEGHDVGGGRLLVRRDGSWRA
jgi:hypothetical protein